MAKVFISAGHGGSDSGAVGNGFEEKNLNLSIALACADYLKVQGVEVLLSRYKDEDDRLNQEVKESNDYAPDLTVSIHNNAGGGDGAEVFHSVNGGKSKVCAENILNEIIKTGQNSRGLKTRTGRGGVDYYGFIRLTNAPAVLVECAFVDNAKDIQAVNTESKRVVMGQAIAKGILTTLGIQNSVTSTPTPTANRKTEREVACEVMEGKWGNGADRKAKIEAAGYNYSTVQAEVNALCGTSTPKPKPAKSVDDIAREVLNGAWGNGADRKAKIEAAGYNYSEVQARVNALSGASTPQPKPTKTLNDIAREVIAGKWGNGQDRKNRLTAAGYDYSAIQAKVNRLL